MEKKFPDKTIIFGQTVPIRYVPLGEDDGEYCTGDKVISIDKDCDEKKVAYILVHEVIHGIADRLDLNSCGLDPNMEELICSSLQSWFEEQDILEISLTKS